MDYFNNTEIYSIPIASSLKKADDFQWECEVSREDSSGFCFKMKIFDKDGIKIIGEFEFEDFCLGYSDFEMVERTEISFYPEDILFGGPYPLDSFLLSKYVSISVDYNQVDETISFALQLSHVDQRGFTRTKVLAEESLYCDPKLFSQDKKLSLDIFREILG